MKERTTYHRMLRVSALVLAGVLLFQSGLFSDTTAIIANNTQNYLANAIGVGAAVQPTELNKYTAALTQKERELAEREAALSEREISINLASSNEARNDTATYVLASILFIMLVLIILNYTMDYLRYREQQQNVKTV